MKVLFSNNYFYIRGGSERVFFDEMNLFRFHGHEVVPFSRQAWIGLFIMLVLTKKD